MTHLGSRGHRNADRADGFTLIELLVVVSLVTLLIAILLPSLQKATALAKRVKCRSNLKNLAWAWSMYLSDNDEQFFQGINANVNYGGWRGIDVSALWPRPLNRYFFADANDITERNAQMFCCPTDRGGVPPTDLYEKAYRLNGTSYQTNLFLIGQDSCGSFSQHTAALDAAIARLLPNLTLSRVPKYHSQILLMGDYGWVNQWTPESYPDLEWKTLAEWHGKPDHHNMAFLDGHAAFVNVQKGIYVAEAYYVVPFDGLFKLAQKVQKPINP